MEVEVLPPVDFRSDLDPTNMYRPLLVLLAFFFMTIVAGCKDFPGADGRYATHGSYIQGPGGTGRWAP